MVALAVLGPTTAIVPAVSAIAAAIEHNRCLLALDQPDTAHARHTAAWNLAVDIGDRLQQARALDGMAHCLNKTGRQDEADRHWRRAAEIYTDLGVPDRIEQDAAQRQ